MLYKHKKQGWYGVLGKVMDPPLSFWSFIHWFVLGFTVYHPSLVSKERIPQAIKILPCFLLSLLPGKPKHEVGKGARK